MSLADADVVVSGGRGVGSAEGFAVIEELAALLGAAVGCSRAVTSAGWRPHTDQVGQTGTKISPSLYIACGISGATQHMAGCKGAKKLMAINPDREASIFASADYAVIGDLHEVVPAISAEIRKSEGRIASSLASALALAAALAVSGTLFADARPPADRARAGRRADPPLRATSPRRARNEAEIVLGQSKLLQRLGPGLMHAFIFWGFLVLVPTILIALIGVVDKHSTLPWLGHQGWYALLVDIFCVLVLAGVIAALWIRKVQRPKRFEGSHLGEADLILALIATIVISLLLWHATRIALHLNEWPASWSPVSNALVAPVRRRPDHEGARARVRLDPRADDPDLPRVPPPLQAPPHLRRRRSTCGSAAPAPAAGSNRSSSTTPTSPRTTFASARASPPTSPGSRCSTRSRAPSAAAARTPARRSRPARSSPRSS